MLTCLWKVLILQNLATTTTPLSPYCSPSTVLSLHCIHTGFLEVLQTGSALGLWTCYFVYIGTQLAQRTHSHLSDSCLKTCHQRGIFLPKWLKIREPELDSWLWRAAPSPLTHFSILLFEWSSEHFSLQDIILTYIYSNEFCVSSIYGIISKKNFALGGAHGYQCQWVRGHPKTFKASKNISSNGPRKYSHGWKILGRCF